MTPPEPLPEGLTAEALAHRDRCTFPDDECLCRVNLFQAREAVADAVRAAREDERVKIAVAIRAASHDLDFEENAMGAAAEGEWSWFGWFFARIAETGGEDHA